VSERVTRGGPHAAPGSAQPAHRPAGRRGQAQRRATGRGPRLPRALPQPRAGALPLAAGGRAAPPPGRTRRLAPHGRRPRGGAHAPLTHSLTHTTHTLSSSLFYFITAPLSDQP
jgi:hypothetical protein